MATVYSSANDCQVREWDVVTGACKNIFKFSDPISCTVIKMEIGAMFTASWDKMVRVIDLERKIISKCFVASKETIKEMLITDDEIIVAGCDPVIRSYGLEDGDAKTYHGHTGWVYCMAIEGDFLFSGGDDNKVRVWDMRNQMCLKALSAHRNGVTSIVMCNGHLFTSAFDHYIIKWDWEAMQISLAEMYRMR